MMMVLLLICAHARLGLTMGPDEQPHVDPLSLEQIAESSEKKTRLRFHELVMAEKQARDEGEEKFLDRFRLSFAYLETFDRNANYDASHQHDWTQQIIFATYYEDHLSPRLKYGLSYKMDTGLNARFSQNDSFVQEIGARSKLRISEPFQLDAAYYLSYYRYPDSTSSSFWSQRANTGLIHYPFKTKRIYHRPNFTWEFRQYRYQKERIDLEDTAVDTDNPRHDVRYTLGHEMGLNPYQSIELTVENKLGFHDSNDRFIDFYDYDFFRTSELITGAYQKWYAIVGFQFERRNYSSRNLLGTAEKEDLPMVYGGLYYALTSKMSLGFNAVYFKSDSNYPDLEYQGATFTLGVYLNFKPSELKPSQMAEHVSKHFN